VRLAIIFFLLTLGFCLVIRNNGGWTWLLLWPALSFLLVGIAYATTDPRVFGKRLDGTIAPMSVVLLLPFLVYTWLIWRVVRQVHRIRSRQPRASRITPDLWLSRRLLRHELPADVSTLVDMTCEFPEARGVVAAVPFYHALPTLDHGSPPQAETLALLRNLQSRGGVVLIHCAQGHGRSALFASALLVARGFAPDGDLAFALVKQNRPNARLTIGQKRALDALVAQLRGKPG